MPTLDSPAWGTHIPVLIKAIEMTNGPVLELGLGYSSTPLLHALCFYMDRKLVSYDYNEGYICRFRRFRTDGHEIHLVSDWDDLDIEHNQWSVVLVDHSPDERRHIEAIRLRNNSEFVILHDSEEVQNDHYHYDRVYPYYKYKYEYDKPKTHATVLSNFKEFKL
jgi:hypothetical protein